MSDAQTKEQITAESAAVIAKCKHVAADHRASDSEKFLAVQAAYEMGVAEGRLLGTHRDGREDDGRLRCRCARGSCEGDVMKTGANASLMLKSVSSCGPSSLGYLCKVPPTGIPRPHSDFAAASRFDSVILVRLQGLRSQGGGLPIGGAPSHATRSSQRFVFGAGVDRLSLGDRGRRFDSARNSKGFRSSAVRARSDWHNTPQSHFWAGEVRLSGQHWFDSNPSSTAAMPSAVNPNFINTPKSFFDLRAEDRWLSAISLSDGHSHVRSPFRRAEVHRLSPSSLSQVRTLTFDSESRPVGRSGASNPMFAHTSGSSLYQTETRQ